MHDQEPTWNPTPEELEAERVYWQRLDRANEYAVWYEMQADVDADELEDEAA